MWLFICAQIQSLIAKARGDRGNLRSAFSSAKNHCLNADGRGLKPPALFEGFVRILAYCKRH